MCHLEQLSHLSLKYLTHVQARVETQPQSVLPLRGENRPRFSHHLPPPRAATSPESAPTKPEKSPSMFSYQVRVVLKNLPVHLSTAGPGERCRAHRTALPPPQEVQKLCGDSTDKGKRSVSSFESRFTKNSCIVGIILKTNSAKNLSLLHPTLRTHIREANRS
jgi:hypothetical protein